MVKYGREWMVICLDNDANVQVFRKMLIEIS